MWEKLLGEYFILSVFAEKNNVQINPACHLKLLMLLSSLLCQPVCVSLTVCS